MVFSNDSNAPLVPAVFTNHASAESAIAALKQTGIPASDIGVAVPVREPNRIRDDANQEVLEGAGRGLAIGAPLGAIGGIAFLAASIGTFGVGGLFLAGAGGMLWGGTVGGLLGMVTRVRRRPNVDSWCELALDDQAVLVAVRVRDWAHEAEIAAVMTQAGATLVLDQLDLDHSWRELEAEHHSGQPAPAIT